MRRTVTLSERAVSDMARARDWYDRINRDLGSRFQDAVVDAFKTAAERPTSCPLVRKGIRTIRCERFPYRVYFETHDDRIAVLAVYHTARNPRLWNDPDRP